MLKLVLAAHDVSVSQPSLIQFVKKKCACACGHVIVGEVY